MPTPAETGRADLTREGALAVLRFDNPPDGFMDEAMERDLLAAVEAVEADDAIRACILTGAEEGVFIRHYDVGVVADRGDALAARGLAFDPGRPVPEGPIHQAMRRMQAGGTAYIAALNGTAMGGGFELALACDLRLVADAPGEYGLPEINLGILPGAGGTQRLPRLIGAAKARELMLLGETLDAAGLEALGLARRVAPEALPEAARAAAARLAAKPPAALAHIKRLLLAAQDLPLDAGLGVERTLFCDLMVREDARRLMREAAQGGRRITDEPDADPAAQEDR
ncbi:MAG: enoyl-CoA hydratase/isomerase family protein [Alphaproteobacteria bacterium]|nr:enoyl-CoA hydratase/isomerase family protein [Alphaproteobacteria bacterium]